MDEVEILLKQMKSEDAETRAGAACQLGEIKVREAVPVLIERLKDENVEVRLSVTVALGEIGDASAVPALIETLKDKIWYVRGNTAWALGNIVKQCETIEDFENVEEVIAKGSPALRKGRVDNGILIDAQMKIAKLTREIAKKKDELAPKKDLLLDDKPKPPKRGRGPYQASRRLRSG